MKLRSSIAALLAVGAFVIAPTIISAQEGEPIVVDEVIAQVNDGVITLSMLKREMRERIEELKQNGMTEQQAADNVAKNQAGIIVTLINGQILLQKGKELDLADEVEAAVNRRMLEIARTQNITSMEKLEEAMKQSGIDPATIKQTMRTEMMKQAVIEREVDAKIYYGPTSDDLHKYFDAHKDQFRKPESVKLSEIFLGLAGKPEADVKARAVQIVTQARGGADFGTLAATYSERESGGVRVAVQNKGDVGLFEVPALRPDIAAAIKNLKAGGISDPLRSDEGFQIIRVDVRNPGSDVPTFNEARVREAITAERTPKEREVYLQNLRNDAYIKLADSYQDSVVPLLKVTPPKTVRAADEKKNKDKNGKP
ncbi:MAG: peptidyl-prolyl cis-trans isomerase SurA [Blastocatellia bacterium]|nr:peptidyl-prolyl cis-trans isomerase SurA [Blastocatellia bacterium]